MSSGELVQFYVLIDAASVRKNPWLLQPVPSSSMPLSSSSGIVADASRLTLSSPGAAPSPIVTVKPALSSLTSPRSTLGKALPELPSLDQQQRPVRQAVPAPHVTGVSPVSFEVDIKIRDAVSFAGPAGGRSLLYHWNADSHSAPAQGRSVQAPRCFYFTLNDGSMVLGAEMIVCKSPFVYGSHMTTRDICCNVAPSPCSPLALCVPSSL